MDKKYPNLFGDGLRDVIQQAQKHSIDLSEADKIVQRYNTIGHGLGDVMPIMIIDFCVGLYAFYHVNVTELSIIRFLNTHLSEIGYLEDQSSWNEFSEIIANSDILEELDTHEKK